MFPLHSNQRPSAARGVFQGTIRYKENGDISQVAYSHVGEQIVDVLSISTFDDNLLGGRGELLRSPGLSDFHYGRAAGGINPVDNLDDPILSSLFSPFKGAAALSSRLGMMAEKEGAEIAAGMAAKTSSNILLNTSKQLQAKFKHAGDFGVVGNYSRANAGKFSAAINQHINSAGVQMINGTYRGQPVIHCLNPNTGLNVISSPWGQFISGWKLNPAQLQNVLKHGGL